MCPAERCWYSALCLAIVTCPTTHMFDHNIKMRDHYMTMVMTWVCGFRAVSLSPRMRVHASRWRSCDVPCGEPCSLHDGGWRHAVSLSPRMRLHACRWRSCDLA